MPEFIPKPRIPEELATKAIEAKYSLPSSNLGMLTYYLTKALSSYLPIAQMEKEQKLSPLETTAYTELLQKSGLPATGGEVDKMGRQKLFDLLKNILPYQKLETEERIKRPLPAGSVEQKTISDLANKLGIDIKPEELSQLNSPTAQKLITEYTRMLNKQQELENRNRLAELRISFYKKAGANQNINKAWALLDRGLKNPYSDEGQSAIKDGISMLKKEGVELPELEAIVKEHTMRNKTPPEEESGIIDTIKNLWNFASSKAVEGAKKVAEGVKRVAENMKTKKKRYSKDELKEMLKKGIINENTPLKEVGEGLYEIGE